MYGFLFIQNSEKQNSQNFKQNSEKMTDVRALFTLNDYGRVVVKVSYP